MPDPDETRTEASQRPDRPEKRPPTTGLFESTDPQLGDEAELFRDLLD